MTRSRRAFLIGGTGAAGMAALATFFWWRGLADGVMMLAPPDVLAAMRDGRLLLVDIRRPDEWKRTGIAKGAFPIDMRRDGFAEAVQKARAGKAIPVAFICARGVRSRRVSNQLQAQGFDTIIDVPEGMLGSFAGPGWLKRGLPVIAWEG